VAGYWTDVSGGYQWVPGFWSPAGTEEVGYYPEPPASLEAGPTSEPPSADYVWIPGCWQWRDARYVWQTGTWTLASPDWVWVPTSYYWCPRGWVLCGGYWDFPLARRGVLLAPVHFATGVYPRPGYLFAPSVVIDAGILGFHFFTRPDYCHYYFGDYYAASYEGLGIFPWFAVRVHRQYAYDPLFSYYDWYHRSRDPRWLGNLRSWNRYYRDHADQRPPHDLAAQRELTARAGDRPDRRFLTIAEGLNDWRRKPENSLQLTTVPAEEKARLAQTGRQLREFTTRRAELEGKAATGFGAGGVRPSERAPATALRAPIRAPLPTLPGIRASEGRIPHIATRPERPSSDTPGPATIEQNRPSRPGSPVIGPQQSTPSMRTPPGMGYREVFKPVIPETPQRTPPMRTPPGAGSREAFKPVIPEMPQRRPSMRTPPGMGSREVFKPVIPEAPQRTPGRPQAESRPQPAAREGVVPHHEGGRQGTGSKQKEDRAR
jgi:hypothetical protein